MTDKKKTTKIEKQTKAKKKQPTELSDGELDSVQGASAALRRGSEESSTVAQKSDGSSEIKRWNCFE